jgi:Cohesin domain
MLRDWMWSKLIGTASTFLAACALILTMAAASARGTDSSLINSFKKFVDVGTMNIQQKLADGTPTFTPTPECPLASLTTTFAGGAANNGNMFDIAAVNSVVIDSFDENLQNNEPLAIYYKAGTHVGSETAASDWTLVGTYPGVVTNGAGVATAVPIPVNIVIPAGQTFAFYITYTTNQGSMGYTPGTAVGNVYASDSNIQIKEGAGKGYPFASTFSPRVFNGTVHYTSYNCPTPSPTNTATSTATNTATPTSTATFTPTPLAIVSGIVTYGNPVTGPDPRGVPDVLISAAGSPSLFDTTTASGQYSLSGFGSGLYSITPSKSGGINGAITGFDAARIAQFLTGNINLTPSQQTVADVSGAGGVSSFDSALIARYAASLPPPNGNSGTWVFTPTAYMHTDITSDIVDDYSALLMGDVSGNWGDNSLRNVFGPARLASVTVESISAKTDGEVLVPVTLRAAADKGIIAYEFDLRYDPTIIEPQRNTVDLAKSVSLGFTGIVNATQPGMLRVVVYGVMPIDGNGVLLTLRFNAVGKAGAVSPLSFDRMMFNEGEPAAAAVGGQIYLQ